MIAYNKQHDAEQTVHVDATLLLTWHTFERREVTMTTAGTMCATDARPTGVVTCGPKFEPMHTAAIVSHNLAHLVGIKHDASDGELARIRALTCV
jgi:hypothetical protein